MKLEQIARARSGSVSIPKFYYRTKEDKLAAVTP